MCDARWDLEGIKVFEGRKIFRLETLVAKFGLIMLLPFTDEVESEVELCESGIYFKQKGESNQMHFRLLSQFGVIGNPYSSTIFRTSMVLPCGSMMCTKYIPFPPHVLKLK